MTSMTDGRDALVGYVARWYETFAVGDAAAMSALYSENARLYLSNLPGVRGRAAIGTFLAGMAQYAELDCRHQVTDVEFKPDDMAVVTGTSQVVVKPRGGGETIRESSRFLMLMEKDRASGAWLCSYDMAQPVPELPKA